MRGRNAPVFLWGYVMATKTAVGSGWTEVAADISALSIIQVVSPGSSLVEFIAAASEPAASAVGIRALSGDSIPDSSIDAIGTGGKLWARRMSGSQSSVIVN